ATLVNAFLRTAEVVLAVVVLLMVLPELSVNIGALLAGVGIAGIAIGFGAQTLVRDTLNGMFILIENQFGIGDVVTVAGVTGRVEEVNLRRTVLRDLDGVVHSVPNSEIRVSSNYTRDWSGVNMNVTVAYDADLDRATAVIDAVGRELAADLDFGPLITQAPHVERVDAFKDSGVSLKVLGVTKPMRQWDVMGELRRRLKKAFDAEKIELRW
ncbi:MAG: mechanosensitive ion channel family protein, partial [Dehalococcoidia bacterium]